MYPQLIELFAKVAPTLSVMFVRGEEQIRFLAEAFPEDKKDAIIASGRPSFDLLDSRFSSYRRGSKKLDPLLPPHLKDDSVKNGRYGVLFVFRLKSD